MKKIILLLFIIPFFNNIMFVKSQDSDYPPTNFTTEIRNATEFAYNEFINVEFYAEIIEPSNNTITKKSNFYPRVDKFSRLVMNGCKFFIFLFLF